MSLPLALDTNLLVRLLTNDDPQQARRVADLIDASPACFVPITVVLELEWVLRGAYQLSREAIIGALRGAYQLSREAIIGALRGLIAIRQLHLEQEEQVLQALEAYGQGLDFAAALHLLRSEGCGALVSFDQAFVRKASELALTPAGQQL